MKSLVIVDVQNDFMEGGTLAVPEANRIIPVINSLLKQFELVVATQDWHPQNHQSFASNHSNKKPFDKINRLGHEETLWPDHCIQGTEGAEFHPDLETNQIAAIFRKGMDPEIDSYSGFYDNDHQKSTGLAGYLKEKKITELYICGLASDICVYHTIRDAINEEFAVLLIEDASQPLDSDVFETLKTKLVGMGVKIIASDEILTI